VNLAPNKTSLEADQLRAMRGSTAVTNIGMQLRYFPFSIRTLLQEKWKPRPFGSLGGQFDSSCQSIFYIGSLGTPLTTFPKYFLF
jgi:hypothetical protein